MSLYGLDLILDQDDKPWLIELNGIRSGMHGFEQVYGDDRVEKKVQSLLQERYGTLTINDGKYQLNKFKKEHPWKYASSRIASKIPLVRNVLYRLPHYLYSQQAFSGWLSERENDLAHLARENYKLWFPFPTYLGQDSTVLNVVNDLTLEHPLVNSYVAEEVTRNKFLQHRLLAPTPLAHLLPPAALVGLGWANASEIEQVIGQVPLSSQVSSSQVIGKPIQGRRGWGLRMLSNNQARALLQEAGPWQEPPPGFIPSFFSLWKNALWKKEEQPQYWEDLVEQRDYRFEYGMYLLQPWIDSRRKVNGEEYFTSIRAIVCNGQFIDAYLRYSPSPYVNIAQGAKATNFSHPGLAELCENIIATYEEECVQLSPNTFREVLYSSYLNEKGRRKIIWGSVIFTCQLISGTIQVVEINTHMPEIDTHIPK
ncbi:MAG: hypothetical protein AABX13_00500 [Nanoarchaeota archaeon]